MIRDSIREGINEKRLLNIIMKMKATTESVLEEYESKPYSHKGLINGIIGLITEFEIWIGEREELITKNDIIQYMANYIRIADVKIDKERESDLNYWYGIKLISHLFVDGFKEDLSIKEFIKDSNLIDYFIDLFVDSKSYSFSETTADILLNFKDIMEIHQIIKIAHGTIRNEKIYKAGRMHFKIEPLLSKHLESIPRDYLKRLYELKLL